MAWTRESVLIGVTALASVCMAGANFWSAAETRYLAKLTVSVSKSNLLYSILKDAREVSEEYAKGNRKATDVFAHMNFSFIIFQEELIDDQNEKRILYDYCQMFSLNRELSEKWRLVDKNFFVDEFTQFVSSIQKGGEIQCE